MKNIINRLSDQIEKDVISIYRHLHQYPELSFQEKETSFFIEEITPNIFILLFDSFSSFEIQASKLTEHS